jgi:hypothetical protein
MKRVLAAFLALALGIPAASVAAQDSSVVVRDTGQAVPDTLTEAQRDSIREASRPVSPMGALWRSLLVPGWGQAKLNRKLTGAVFITFEGISLGMAMKADRELDYARRTGSERVTSKEKERQDWLFLLGFNHLIAALEAYVSAHLWDFPPDIQLRALPGRGIEGGVTIPVRIP